MSFENQLPPYSIEAEIAVLGAALLSPDALEKMLDLLTAADFYRAGNKLIFQAFADMASKSIEVDTVTLQEELRSNGTFAESGGLAYLLLLMDQLPTVANIEHYAKIVMQKSVRRNLIDAAMLATGLAYQEAMDLDNILEQSESAFQAVKDTRKTKAKTYITARDAGIENYNRVADQAESGIRMRGKSCGYKEIDNMLSGLADEDLIVIAARPSMGKSALAECIAINFERINQLGVAFFSLEMNATSLVTRMQSILSNVPVKTIQRSDLLSYEWTMFSEGTNKLSENIHFYTEDCYTLSSIVSKSKELAKEKPTGLIIVDYLQKMQSSISKNRNRADEVGEFSNGLKNLARTMKVPVIALAQLNRGVESRDSKRPGLADLKGSGSIEQDADIVAFIYRDDYYKKKEPGQLQPVSTIPQIAEIIIAKNRNGETGSCNLGWIPRYTSFIDMDIEGEATSF